MKSLKFSMLVAALLLATPTVFASAQSANAQSGTRWINVQVINAAVAQKLKPLNNKTTQLSSVLESAEVDSSRALQANGELTAVKSGHLPAALKIDYNYTNLEGQPAPVLNVNATLAANNGGMRKILVNLGVKPTQMDAFFVQAQKIIQKLGADLLHRYGQGVKVNTQIYGLQKDAQNHYVAENVGINATIDLSRLPANVTPDSVMMRSLSLTLSLNLNSGAKLVSSVILNNQYKDFQQNQMGLKQYLEKLEQKDPDTLHDVAYYAQMAEYFINSATGDQSANF